MTLYETIFKRRSVRRYDPAPPDDSMLAGLQNMLDGAEQMEGQSARFQIVPATGTSGVAAPYCILAYCEPNAAAYANVGYVLQKADLYLQSIGLGSLWMGMAKPVGGKKDFGILLAFGKTDVPMRESLDGFSRLPLSELCDTDNEVSRAVRLAPSAVNSQPWKLELADGKVTLRYFGRAMKLILKKRLNKIDLGIAARHAQLALQEQGKEVTSVSAQAAGKDFCIELQYH